jgi:hypothetical protein
MVGGEFEKKFQLHVFTIDFFVAPDLQTDWQKSEKFPSVFEQTRGLSPSGRSATEFAQAFGWPRHLAQG